MKTVLLCEDDPEMATLIRQVVERAGYALITAPDGVQAVAAALQRQPALVLMDVYMPQMDGIAATRTLREKGFKSPIVMLTASEKKQDRKWATDAGCNGFLLKSLAMSDVEETLERLLGGPGGGDEIDLSAVG